MSHVCKVFYPTTIFNIKITAAGLQQTIFFLVNLTFLSITVQTKITAERKLCYCKSLLYIIANLIVYANVYTFLLLVFADRTVLLWDIKDLSQKGQKSLRRINIDFDYATLVKWSPDTRAFIISKYTFNTLEVYKIEKKQGCLGPISKSFTFPKVLKLL